MFQHSLAMVVYIVFGYGQTQWIYLNYLTKSTTFGQHSCINLIFMTTETILPPKEGEFGWEIRFVMEWEAINFASQKLVMAIV